MRLNRLFDLAGAMALEALRGTPVAFDERIHQARPHPGQIQAAAHLRALLRDSEIRESHLHNDPRVQDAYCLRCMPQVHGAARGALQHVREVIEIETGSATDNPLIFSGDVLSGGNFHGAPLGMALDYAAIAVTDLMSISERRIDRLINPDCNEGLPPFLSQAAGLSSGLMIAHVTAAALLNEAKVLAHPASVDSLPTSGGKEDHVSMGMTAALKLKQIVDNAEKVLAIELMTAAPGTRIPPAAQGRDGDRASARNSCAHWFPRWRKIGSSQEISNAWQRGFAMETLIAGPHKGAIRAPRGTRLSTKGWQQEAALRMLMNNLDPEVAEAPEELVVYGGTGKAARDWPCFYAIVRALESLENDETLLIQSGKPVGILRTHAMAPRVLIANANLVGKWSSWEVFRELEQKGLMMYGQMTAGSWIYIGSQGIVQGTYETFAEAGRKHFGGSLEGKLIVSGGMGGMGGAQPLAATMTGARFLGIDVDPKRIQKRVDSGYCDRIAGHRR